MIGDCGSLSRAAFIMFFISPPGFVCGGASLVSFVRSFVNRSGRLFGNSVLDVMLVLVICGCGGPEGPATVTVTGSVSLDGKPVTSGQIIFYDVAGVEKA